MTEIIKQCTEATMALIFSPSTPATRWPDYIILTSGSMNPTASPELCRTLGSMALVHPVRTTGSLALLHSIRTAGSMARLYPLPVYRTPGSMALLHPICTPGSMALLHPIRTTDSMARVIPSALPARWPD